MQPCTPWCAAMTQPGAACCALLARPTTAWLAEQRSSIIQQRSCSLQLARGHDRLLDAFLSICGCGITGPALAACLCSTHLLRGCTQNSSSPGQRGGSAARCWRHHPQGLRAATPGPLVRAVLCWGGIAIMPGASYGS